MRLNFFLTINSSVNAAGDHFHGKGIKWKTFPNNYVVGLYGVVVRCSRVEPKVQGSSPAYYLLDTLV